MKNWERRIAALETAIDARCNDNPQNCGRGVRVTRAMASEVCNNRCSQHGRKCWHREDPVKFAGAVLLIEEMKLVQDTVKAGASWGQAWEVASRDGGVDTSNPPAWLVEQCREELLAQGVELLVEEDE